MYFWHKSSADLGWRKRYRDTIADSFFAMTGIALGEGSQYDNAGQRMEIHHHPAINEEHIIAIESEFPTMLIGGAHTLPSWDRVVEDKDESIPA